MSDKRGGLPLHDPGNRPDLGRYTAGHCHSLAFALAARTGWELRSVREAGHTKIGPILHVYVRTPDGRAVDAEGVHHEDDMAERWAARSSTGKAMCCAVTHRGAVRSLPLTPDVAGAETHAAEILSWVRLGALTATAGRILTRR